MTHTTEQIPFPAVVLSGPALSKSEHNAPGCLWGQESHYKLLISPGEHFLPIGLKVCLTEVLEFGITPPQQFLLA